MDFLASPRGLVAIQDISGKCRTALNLSNRQAQIAADIISGSLSRSAVCDFGADDTTIADCPDKLERSIFKFQGTTNW
ncbi:MAG: hypothetical protein H3C43_11130 [Leptonema sp. (in: Bacteria)]|nr:hypothetical protein [Leptonema sp. (in: bacteria)]